MFLPQEIIIISQHIIVFLPQDIPIISAESLRDPYLRQVPLPRIPASRNFRSTQYAKDIVPAKLTVKPQRLTESAAMRLNGPSLQLTRRTHVFCALGHITVQ